MPFELMYPDVLGAVTGGSRITMGELQFAVGIYPKRAFLNQPIEIIVVMQSLIDSKVKARVGIQYPAEDKRGNPVTIRTPKKTVEVEMNAAEVGVLHIPLVAVAPTPTGIRFPVRVAVRYRAPKNSSVIRPPSGGAPPSVLSISPFKLQVLQEIDFESHLWNQSAEIVTAYFEIAPQNMPVPQQALKTRYEILWNHESIEDEHEAADAMKELARSVASGFTRVNIFEALIEAVDVHFSDLGMVLHPGEAVAVAKIMTYALDQGLEMEPGFSIEKSHWFRTLCRVLAADEEIQNWNRGDIAVYHLFEAALFDAMLLGFDLIGRHVDEDLGDEAAQLNYANRVMNWVHGHGSADLSYIYLPLTMAALVVNSKVFTRDYNPWTTLEQLNEAYKGRARLASGESGVIFQMVEELLEYAQSELARLHIPRP